MHLRELLHPVRDQGNRPTCLSIATSDGHHAARGVGPRLASDFLHFNAAKSQGIGANEAVSVTAVIDALRTQGQPAEVECPYSTTPLPTGWTPPTPTGSLWRHQTTLATTGIWTMICKVIDSGRPVILIMNIDDAFWEPIAGVVEKPSVAPRAMHAVLAIAMTTTRTQVLVRNSWGEEWGDGGYCWLSSAYVAVRCTAVITFEGAPS